MNADTDGGYAFVHPDDIAERPDDALRREILIQPLPAMLLELTLALPQPRIATLPAPSHDLLRVQLKRHLVVRLCVALIGRLGALFLAPQLLADPAEELPPPLRNAQLLGQLITPRPAELLILGPVGRDRLGDDLRGNLLEGVVSSGLAFPAGSRTSDRGKHTSGRG